MTPAADSRGVASKAADLLAVDPAGLAGATLRGRPGPTRDAWLARHRSLLAADTVWRRLPPNIAEGRLLGGLDLAATLDAGRPVAERGLLAEADGGVLVAAMAERLDAGVVGPLAAAIDTGEVVTERDGIAARAAARVTLLLLDEGIDDERVSAALADRLAFLVDVDADAGTGSSVTRDDIAAARARLDAIAIDEAALETICTVGPMFGVESLRIASFVLKAARAAAALAGHDRVTPEDLALAVTLVVAPRATRMPAPSEPQLEPEADDDPTPRDVPPSHDGPHDDAPNDDARSRETDASALAEHVVEAARAALPPGLLAALSAEHEPRSRHGTGGRAGAMRASQQRGRPVGVRRGRPGRGARLALVDTLRAAAPWQTLRRASRFDATARLVVTRDDLRVARFQQRSETTTILVVDASGSAAFARLAEVKGAVELILADCYVRRDSVALIAFRGATAEVVLPPTRSLTRAKRALAGQLGGGGTPLATAIEQATALAAAQRRRGATPLVVLLTDGHANVSRSGRPGRAEAGADALAAARVLRSSGHPCLLIDVAPRPQAAARTLADALGARYQPLPFVDARAVSHAVLATAATVR